jgi:hypothetical protein
MNLFYEQAHESELDPSSQSNDEEATTHSATQPSTLMSEKHHPERNVLPSSQPSK